MSILTGGRIGAALVCAYLIAVATVPANAVTQVQTGDPGGNLLCYNCGNSNKTQKSGNAVAGYVDDNGDGSASAGIGYTTPNDGSSYSGTISIVTTDANGNLISNFTGSISDYGDGTIMYSGFDGVNLPVGGSVSISVSESNGAGRSFSAGWALRNYRP